MGKEKKFFFEKALDNITLLCHNVSGVMSIAAPETVNNAGQIAADAGDDPAENRMRRIFRRGKTPRRPVNQSA